MLTTFTIATILITLAELGDKTQVLALILACRYKAWQVLVGIFAATLVVHLLSTIVGAAVGDFIPENVLAVVTGLLFIGFGVWGLWEDTSREQAKEEEQAEKVSRLGPIVATAVAFFLAELGDKTQIMTMSIAADPAAALRSLKHALPVLTAGVPAPVGRSATFWGVWMGSTAGMMIADGAAIIVGSVMSKKLPERLITRVSAVFFVLFGVVTLALAFLD